MQNVLHVLYLRYCSVHVTTASSNYSVIFTCVRKRLQVSFIQILFDSHVILLIKKEFTANAQLREKTCSIWFEQNSKVSREMNRNT